MNEPKMDRKTGSSVVLNKLEQINERANALATRQREKLAPVLRPEPPAGQALTPVNDDSMPQLFQAMLSILLDIEASLDSMSETIYRADL